MRFVMRVGLWFFTILVFSSCTVNQDIDLVADVEHDLAIANVDLYDSENKVIVENKTILIDGDKISDIIDNSDSYVANRVIQGEGSLVTPGFIDTHAHLLLMLGNGGNGPNKLTSDMREILARQYLAYGTTTIVDMGQPENWLETTIEWQNNPLPEYPNLFVTSASINSESDRRMPMHHIGISGVQGVVEKIRSYADSGVERIKLYRKLELDDMAIVVDEAKNHGMRVFAHTDNNVVTISQAMEIGVQDFEHLFTLIPSVLDIKKNNSLLNEMYSIHSPKSMHEWVASLVFYFDLINGNTEHKSNYVALIDEMAKNGATISTAINMLGSVSNSTTYFSTFDPLPYQEKATLPYSKVQVEKLEKATKVMLNLIKLAHDRGVKIRIGTDARNGGETLLSELILLAEGGFPMHDVLQIATWNGAEAIGIEADVGSISAGKKADLIIFKENPFIDARHLLSEKVIVKDGKIAKVPQSAAFAMLDIIEQDGFENGKAWLEKNKSKERYGKLLEVEMNEVAYRLLHKGQVANALSIFSYIDELFPESETSMNIMDERQYNSLGYMLMNQGLIEGAIKVFKYNVEKFPNSKNVHDSLGEAYQEAEKYKLAILSYRRVLELDPDNLNAVTMLEKLQNLSE